MKLRLLLAVCVVSSGCGSIEYGSSVESGRASSADYVVSEAAPDEVSVSISMFIEELATYGEWVPHPSHGQIFVPYDADYRPYRNGRWVRNGEELVWVSYDAIGWAVCHYGSWTVLEDGRWAWIPGTEWAPAWVEWRESEHYVGWAPQMTGVVVQPEMAWVFVETTYLLVDYVSTIFLPVDDVPVLYADCLPMRTRPDRGWLERRGVANARGGSVSVRRGPPAGAHRRASNGSIRVRDPFPRASGGTVTVRGPARSGLVEAPPPRETVVLGRGRALSAVTEFDGPDSAAIRPDLPPEPRVPYIAQPRPGPYGFAPPSQIAVEPRPEPEPRVIVAPPRPIGPSPRPYVEPAPRFVSPEPRPEPLRRVVMAPPRPIPPGPAFQPPPRVEQPSGPVYERPEPPSRASSRSSSSSSSSSTSSRASSSSGSRRDEASEPATSPAAAGGAVVRRR